MDLKFEMASGAAKMLSYLNESNTAVVVLHEIYGINQHIKDICLQFSSYGFDVFAPNILQAGTVFDSDQEGLAYSNFFQNIGFEKAFEQVTLFLHQIRDRYAKVFVVGFSAGATVAWLCSQEPELCSAIVGFYGSRIRDYLDIEVNCPVLLFAPAKEESFNISDFMATAKVKSNVLVKQLDGLHGFTNPYSPNFNKQLTDSAYKYMLQFIKNNGILYRT
jgi:dienelactone hydrolase